MKIDKRFLLMGMATMAFASYQLHGQSDSDEKRSRRKPPSIDQLFKDLDADEDGKLSRKEVKGPLTKHFNTVDLNEDGYLTREELEKAPKPERKGPPNRNG